MRTTREKPSSVTLSTVPVPSTWPCMTWPPRRSPARSGSSRFTSSPIWSGASAVRRSVSGITSAAKEPLSRSVAVRHTPLTAIESPGASSPASGVSTSTRPCAKPRTTPFPATSPVNTSPLLEAGNEQVVVVDPLGLDGERPGRGGDLAEADPLHRGPRLRAAELVERVLHARALVLTGGDDHVHARGLERLDRRALRGARADHDQRDVRHVLHEPRVEREAALRVEDDAARLACDALDARGEARVVHERGADADGDRVRLRSPAVRAGAAGLAGDPLRVACAGGHLAVERHCGLEDHERAPCARVLEEGLVEHARGVRDVAVHEVDPDALVAQDARPAAR